MRAVMQAEPLGLHLVFDRAEALFADRSVVTREPDGLTTSTFGAVFERARGLAALLAGLGLAPGDPVGTFGWNTAGHLAAYIAVPGSGLVLHTINIRLSADEIAYTVGHARDRVVLVDGTLWNTWARVDPPDCVEHVLVYGPAPELPGRHGKAVVVRLGELPVAARKPWYRPEDEHEASGICYTSGTTGKPKAVVYSHRSVYLHALTLCGADTFAISHHDVVLPVVPMFHANSWNLPYAALLAGAGLAFPAAATDPASLAECIEATGATFSAAVPTVWSNLVTAVRAGEVGEAALSSLRRVVIGGSAASETLLTQLSGLGIEPVHAWGMTECSPVGLVAGPPVGGGGEDYRTSQGRPMPGLATKVGADGELRISGPYVVAAYHQPDTAGTEEKFTDEDGRRWLRTGDVATVDARGYVRLVDRTKDLVKSGGEWISSVDLENHLLAHPAVREAAVIAVPDPKWDERPLAVVATSAEVEAARLREFLLTRVPKWQVADRFEFVEEVPKTSVGKLDKKLLRGRYA
ncbi:long-chain fatty acid--CoA ligase [Amycolatopsis acidicola]|uniref:Long-chain fatty acid--CoA ligase n=1 Tax=Amycolatopsis acidicola TaxID=2596893 RepID=A0A5N0V0H9_9PSEU|nr:AMP-binding protein [Amycolatopsis acidicola]KAA9157610.1 long-chain fatty acid--CoA ligase [Amycolatopsis acidicola]